MIRIAMTPAQFTAKAAQLKTEQGLDVGAGKGTLSKDGVTASYEYDQATLTVEIIHKPMIYPMSVCESKLRAWLTA